MNNSLLTGQQAAAGRNADETGEPFNHTVLLSAGTFQTTAYGGPSKHNTVISRSEVGVGGGGGQGTRGERTKQRRAPEICVKSPLDSVISIE